MQSSPVTTPLRRLAIASTATCSQQATAYGKCILATYTDVKKDACKEEFARFGACMREAVGAIKLDATLFLKDLSDETQMVKVLMRHAALVQALGTIWPQKL